MAIAYETVVARLEASTGVGSHAGDRIYPLSLPLNPTLPALTYQQVSGVHEHTHDGRANLQAVRMQVDSWARTYTAVRDLANEVRKSLDTYSGSTGGLKVQATFIDGERDLFEGESDQDRIYRVSQDFILWTQEST